MEIITIIFLVALLFIVYWCAWREIRILSEMNAEVLRVNDKLMSALKSFEINADAILRRIEEAKK